MKMTPHNIKYVTALAYNGAIYSWSVTLRSGGSTDIRQYVNRDKSYRSTAQVEYPKSKLPFMVREFLDKSVCEKCWSKDGFASYIYK